MDPRTARVYERHAEAWAAERRAQPRGLRRIRELVRSLPSGARVGDLGCGPGWYAEAIARAGARPVGLDLSGAQLRAARGSWPELDWLRADLARLPLRRAALDGAVALNAYQHLPAGELPAALADLHRVLREDAPVCMTLCALDAVAPTERERARGEATRRFDDDAFRGRLFIARSNEEIERLVHGAGFEVERLDRPGRPFWTWCRMRRAHTLPDYVRPGLRLLVCGLNPSPTAAETGIPFGRPGNRFWPAARAAGVLDASADRDPWAALAAGVGFTDLVKRTTRRADALTAAEYAAGFERLRVSVARLRPQVVCFVGLAGYRQAVDKKARPGWLPQRIARRPAYLMPSTSGLNAHARLDDLAAHLRRAARGPDDARA